MLSVAGL